jgi:hypothetical protein
MNDGMQKIEMFLSELRFSFGYGFSDRLMERIMQLEQPRSPSYYLNADISRMFYWVSLPGLAATVIMLLIMLLSGDPNPSTYQHQYTSSFMELLDTYYYQLD